MRRIFVFLLLFFLRLHAAECDCEKQWEHTFTAYFAHNKVPYLDQVRFYTYLYAAQLDATDYPGNIQNSVTARLTERFFPNFPFSETIEKDLIAESILCKYYVRMKQEEENPHTFSSSCWLNPIPKPIRQIAQWIPWSEPLPVPPPPLPLHDKKAWMAQLDELKQMRQAMTPEDHEIVQKWTGHHGPGANWRVIANSYMKEQEVPLKKARLARSILMKALYDGLIAEMDAKYTYCMPRPFMMFPEFKCLIKKLKTPSYPSGHGIAGSIFGTVLTYFFPENFTYWHYVDVTGGNIRLWAGVHFPEDIKQGRILGAKIAYQLLNTLNDSKAFPNQTFFTP